MIFTVGKDAEKKKRKSMENIKKKNLQNKGRRYVNFIFLAISLNYNSQLLLYLSSFYVTRNHVLNFKIGIWGFINLSNQEYHL